MHLRPIAVATALACLGLVLVGGTAAAAKPVPRAHASIIGGRAASIQELPSLAYLEGENAKSGYSCSGTVVAPRLVLTAGHCVEDIESGEVTPPAGFAVATGIADLNRISAANVSRVAQAVVFPGFEPGNLRGDAGLLILTAPVSAPAIALASSAGDGGLLTPGTPLTIAGWGLTSGNAKEAPAQLMAGRTTVESVNSCRTKSQRYYPFYSPAQQLCAIDSPQYRVSACHGDSGGPAIATRADGAAVEVGIVSTGGPGCSTALPNVFTRVDRVSSWVRRWIAAIEAGGPRPAIKVPTVHTPFLSVSDARELAAVGFAHDFRRHFTGSTERRISCRRVARARVRCRVGWYQGGDDYWGSVTVYYRVVKNTVGWGFNYRINWVDNYCYFYSGHRASCKVHTKHR
jgi:secreted trypsin-like serine protease